MQRTMSSPNQSMSKAAEAGLLSVPQDLTFYADSGVRFDPNCPPQLAGPGPSPSTEALAQTHGLTDVPPLYSAT